jgi:hypothetical protein
MKQTEPVVMYWGIHAAGMRAGVLVLCEDCDRYEPGAVSVGPNQYVDGNCKVNGAVFACCPFNCPDFRAKTGDATERASSRHRKASST